MKTNYAGIPDIYAKKETSKIVIVPTPFKSSQNDQTNLDKGFQAFLNASNHLEKYDIETASEVYKQGIYIADTVNTQLSAENVNDLVYETTKTYLKTKKFVTVFGGDNTTSIGVIKAFNDHFEGLSVLHLNAHTNIHKEYEGVKVHEKCAMYHASQVTNLVQVGIRNMDKIETTVLDEEKTFFAKDMAEDEYWTENAVELLTNQVLVSIDLDVFDPSIVPGVKNPSPGGLLWFETLSFLKKVIQEKKVVGLELVGLNPLENNQTSEFFTAKLFQKLVSYIFENNDIAEDDDTENFADKKNKSSKFNDIED